MGRGEREKFQNYVAENFFAILNMSNTQSVQSRVIKSILKEVYQSKTHMSDRRSLWPGFLGRNMFVVNEE